MLRGWTMLGWFLGVAATAAACGSEADSLGTENGGGSSGSAGGHAGASGSAGTEQSGGTGGSTTGGTGGTGGSGGSAGAAGSAGSGGTTADCAPPNEPSKASLCLSLEPEVMQLVAQDPELDGVGTLIVEIFDRPDADTQGVVPLTRFVLPEGSGPGKPGALSIGDIPETLRFDGLPATVYVRSLFIDNDAMFQGGKPTWGAWIGGVTLDEGLRQRELDGVPLSVGSGTAVTQPMGALRKLEVTVDVQKGTKLPDDGLGPLRFVSAKSAKLEKDMAVFGAGAVDCADLRAGHTATVSGVAVTSGKHFVLAQFDDFNLGQSMSGQVVNAKLEPGGITLTDSVTFAPDQYKATTSVSLSTLTPQNGPPPASYTCP